MPAHKEAMDFYFAKHPRAEREFQQIILRENNKDIDLTLDPENVELLFVLANHDPEKSRLLREIKTAMSELQGTEDEKYLSEIKIARSSLMGYGLYSYDKNGNDRFYSL